MPPWANQHEIAADTGLPHDEVATRLDRLRNRWAKSVPALTPMRDDVLRMLEDHGRILEWRQLAAALLARRGSGLEDAAARMILAGVCVRAAIETEERRQEPRLTTRRLGQKVLIALTRVGDDAVPDADDLFAYAELLGDEADKLAVEGPAARRDRDQAGTAGRARRGPGIEAVRYRPGPARRRRVRERGGHRPP